MSFIPNLPVHTLTLLGGVVSTSYVFFMHIGLSQVGVIPLIRDQLGNSGMSPLQKVQAWGMFFGPISILSVGGTLIGSLFNLTTAYLTTSSQIKNLTLAAGILGPLMVPYTMTFIMPTNNRLGELGKLVTLTESQQKEALQLIAKWDFWHKTRFVVFGGCWVLAFSALILAGRFDRRKLE